MDEDKYRPLSNPHGNTNSDTTEDTTSIESEDLGEIQSGYSKSMNVDDQDDEDRSGKLKSMVWQHFVRKKRSEDLEITEVMWLLFLVVAWACPTVVSIVVSLILSRDFVIVGLSAIGATAYDGVINRCSQEFSIFSAFWGIVRLDEVSFSSQIEVFERKHIPSLFRGSLTVAVLLCSSHSLLPNSGRVLPLPGYGKFFI
ncbi:hypothetical protein Ancab_034279 [Ancistrocladus abbreviatus]